jgi:hypothetical protein
MTITYRVNDDLPRLAWCAEICRATDEIVVYCGKWVEQTDHAFFEGVWAGEFDTFGFCDAPVSFGSGGRLVGDKIVFSTPTHPLERLFSVSSASQICLSNSLSFVLALSGKELDSSYIPFHSDYDSITLGLDRYVRELPLRDGSKVRMYCHSNIELDHDLRVRETPKALISEPIESFQQYERLLLAILDSLRRNGASGTRRRSYRLLATVSTGYDSSSIAALARDVGCSEAVTVLGSRPRSQVIGKYRYLDKHIDDSGEHIADQLGYSTTHKCDRNEYFKATTPQLEAESCASGSLYIEPSLLYYNSLLEQTILLTGHFGDVIWGMSGEAHGGLFAGGALSGASLYESRLRIGFVHAPLPYVAASQVSEIKQISRSQVMAPWRLDKPYDRPIPRRFLEERGVERGAFGQSKKAIQVMLLGTKANVTSQMSAVARHDFENYLAMRHGRSPLVQIGFDLMVGLYATPALLRAPLHRVGLGAKISRIHHYMHDRWFRYSRSGRAGSYLFGWGISRITPRYKVAGPLVTAQVDAYRGRSEATC